MWTNEAERNAFVIQSEAYQKIKTAVDPIMIGFGGSNAYGTTVEGSDFDIRGFAYNPVEEVLGIRADFEQYQDPENDVTIYSLKKILTLLVQNNPNTMEILGLRPEEILFLSDAGRLILDHSELFLSKRSIYTFGGYARAQLNRLMNMTGRDGDMAAANEAAVEQRKINKHMMHLIRLYMMGIDILRDGVITTYRAKEHDLLMDIRNGKYMMTDSLTPTPEFEELLEHYAQEFDQASKETKLPDDPYIKEINELAIKINRDYLNK